MNDEVKVTFGDKTINVTNVENNTKISDISWPNLPKCSLKLESGTILASLEMIFDYDDAKALEALFKEFQEQPATMTIDDETYFIDDVEHFLTGGEMNYNKETKTFTKVMGKPNE